MSEQDSQSELTSAANPPKNMDYAGGKAALVEATQHKDFLFSSLAGVGAIVVVLLVALALPVFGGSAIKSVGIFLILSFSALIGLAVLSVINFQAHNAITNQALRTEVLLNSLGQGFLSFDSKGVCGDVYSLACLDLLEGSPANKNIVDVLRLNEEQRNDFKDWVEMLFAPNHALSFDDVVKFLPQTFVHSDKNRRIGIVYRPVRDKAEQLLSIILIATDRTEEAEAELRAKAQQNFVAMISRIFKERSQFMVTITHLRKFIEDSKAPVKKDDASTILRLLHTLKASAKHYHMDAMSSAIHKLEAELRSTDIQSDEEFQSLLRKGGDNIGECLKAVLDQIGDLIGQDFEGRGNLREIDEDMIYSFARFMRDQKVDPALIRQYLSAIAALPINDAFHQFERELKDLAVIMGKRVKPVHYTGTNPPVLMQPMEGFLLSIMHICRNIVDHGIEPAVTRLARGKDPSGQVTIHTDLIDSAETGRKMLQIDISDDGNGIDPALVRQKLAKIDPDGAWQKDDDEKVIQRILLWEVSTRAEVSEMSGRGVGMEAVDREVRLLGGTIKVSSDLYRGTKFEIRIPYGLDVPEPKI